MKKFLLSSRSETLESFQPTIVLADSAEEAILKYQKNVACKDPVFREWVLDLNVNLSFAEQFYLATEKEFDEFMETAASDTDIEIVKERIRAFFSTLPELGERYLRYMETQDVSVITDDVFEFIAVSETQKEHGMVARDLEEIPVLC